MVDWTHVNDGLPYSETVCMVAQKIGESSKTYPKLVEWSGSEWVDIDGDVVENVEWWMKAPLFEKTQRAIEKLKGCYENDKCEMKDCCYYPMLDEIEALLEYMRK